MCAVLVAEKMSSGRTVGSLETWQPDDKSFNKHILTEGRGELTPNDESICLVHIVSIGNAALLLVNCESQFQKCFDDLTTRSRVSE